ncbi:ATP-dependent acyl-CoA ligase [Halalkalibacter krulwichiae]|uniref:Long-chain-fatty-acid--CoA ligase n=1 Tax=Halalkalibacter krulwichiae TaxID=199441 RepID=A0A1X9M922_9BACI|nr:ATP-dependent acyl-CoA ligase [Halalkalibacter krulwichiae]ARK29959.1 Long-chain-fatty-acid--CoA ligase [Halalkalibacter krulwichiae]
MYTGPQTFGEIVEHRAKLRPYDRFIRFLDDELTYGEYHQQGNQVANAALSLGLRKGDSCAVMLPNSREFLITWLGLARIGAIEVPINTGFRGDLLAYILNQARCQSIVIQSDWIERINDLANQLQYLKQVIVVGALPEQKSNLFTWYSFEQLISQASDHRIEASIQANDPSLILFTSGTTGPSKGVVLTHSANFSLAHTACEVMEYKREDRLFTVFPLFHVNARYTTVLVALLVGCDVVMHDRFSASKFWDICRKEGITAFNFMGSMLTILMKQKQQANDDDHSVRKAYGAPTPIEIYEDFKQRFQVEITEVYGSTELGTVAANPAKQFRKGACGKILPIYEVEIHDENNQPCPVGKSGEIVVRPKKPGIMFTDYYGNAEATIKAWQDLWFHTGDTGRLDEDGYLYFIDRKKDVVRRRGENISSYEVERVINDHPQVLEAAIIGVPSELSEEEVLAAVIVKEGEKLSPENLLNFCQSRMAHFAIPRYIRFVKSLPRTPSQRVEKYKLRTEGITDDTWDREQIGFQVKR